MALDREPVCVPEAVCDEDAHVTELTAMLKGLAGSSPMALGKEPVCMLEVACDEDLNTRVMNLLVMLGELAGSSEGSGLGASLHARRSQRFEHARACVGSVHSHVERVGQVLARGFWKGASLHARRSLCASMFASVGAKRPHSLSTHIKDGTLELAHTHTAITQSHTSPPTSRMARLSSRSHSHRSHTITHRNNCS